MRYLKNLQRVPLGGASRAGPGRAALSTRKTAACAIFTFQLFPPFLITGSKLESRIFLLSRGGRLSPTISGL